jgi:superfamily II DNA or RNA helicase
VAYEDLIAAKAGFVDFDGIRGAKLGKYLFPHQIDLVGWALRRGRAAIFADTGLGKTAMQLEWAKHVAKHGRVLILTPLAVAQQTVAEGERFGIETEYARHDTGARILVTNYEMLHAFDPSLFVGVVLDESSILKAYDGKTRNQLIRSFQSTPYRLACTATPAPNDFTELGNHCEFLGVKLRTEMLSEFFAHDGGSTKDWRLKGHAVRPFWEWVSTWGAVVRLPSDLGHDDGTFRLPPIEMHEHVLALHEHEVAETGFLFAMDASTLNEQRAVRRATMENRASVAASLVTNGEPALVWCELNAEADAITEAIPGAVQVRGADDMDTKIERLVGFSKGDYRVLVTKPSIAGHGLNWQHCANVVFAGVSHSYEQTYQAIRRCWRFGQTRSVHVHMIRAETEGMVMANYRRKEADAARMASEIVEHVRASMWAQIRGTGRRWNTYEPKEEMVVPQWIGMEVAA